MALTVDGVSITASTLAVTRSAPFSKQFLLRGILGNTAIFADLLI